MVPKKTKLTVCAIAKNEDNYLAEWVAFYKLQGADQIVIYDNGHGDYGDRLLQALDDNDVITRICWGGEFMNGPQLPAYKHAIERVSGLTEWLLIVDLDEFVVTNQHENLVEFLDSLENVDGVWFPWLIFGSAGHEHYEPGLLVERFPYRQAIDASTRTPIKMAIRPEVIIDIDGGGRCDRPDDRLGIHMHNSLSTRFVNPLGINRFLKNQSGGRRNSQLASGFEVARVHHYMTKSRQEWKQKIARGRADRGIADLSSAKCKREDIEFARWDRNEVYDAAALKYSDRLRATVSTYNSWV